MNLHQNPKKVGKKIRMKTIVTYCKDCETVTVQIVPRDYKMIGEKKR